MASNPIEQRIEHMAETWELQKIKQQAPIIRLQCQPDEVDMVDTFYTYMLATDGLTTDIAFYMESICTNIDTFSHQLLDELTETMNVWKESEKNEGIEYTPVDWEVDNKFQKNKNSAAHFIHNFNSLAKAMDLPDGIFAVAIIAGNNYNPLFIKWLEAAIAHGIAPNVKILINDSVDNTYFNAFALAQRDGVYTIPINMDMPTALEQTAAMGDPHEPATAYRVAYVTFMNAMAKNNESDTEKKGQACFTLAEKNLAKDPYWITQLVTIKIALANDKLKYKKKSKAIELAHEAVAIAQSAGIHFKANEVSQLTAQAQMFRGTLLFTNSNYNEAYTDFIEAFAIYKQNNSQHLAIEAIRMAGEAANKQGVTPNYYAALKEGIVYGSTAEADIILSSTYHYLIYNYLGAVQEKILPYEQVEAIGITYYGNNWIATVNKATNSYLDYAMEKQMEEV